MKPSIRSFAFGSANWASAAGSGNWSGSGASGAGKECSTPSSATWNDAESEKIALPCWIALTRRVVKLRPSRMRSTSNTIGTRGSPPSMK